MFCTDKPILNSDEDTLGRNAFAKQLANAIMQFDTMDNYAISLQGRWGCGKTSILNMAVEEINNLSKQMPKDGQVIIVKFNPWNFMDTNQLINQFFLELSKELKIGNKGVRNKKIGEAIENYSAVLECTGCIPIFGNYLKIVPKIAKNFGKSVKESAEKKQNDILGRKRELEEALKKLELKILVIIDDIDRLSNEQIRLIFQLVSAVADLPNLIYLLSFDSEIVARALGDVQHCDGKEYLEKIIQVPFDVPALDSSKVQKILLEKLKGLFENNNGMEFDQKRWARVLGNCISPFTKTLRDINRYYNVFSFMYVSVKTEVDFIDMAGISALSIFAPTIFEWIRDNKYNLVGGYENKSYVVRELEERKKDTIHLFSEIYPKNPELMLNAVASLFPMFSNRVMLPMDQTSSNELYYSMRISTREKFDLYFSLSLESVKIPRKEMDESLFNMNEQELRCYINSLEERKLFRQYIEEFKHSLSRTTVGRIELFLSVLVFRKGNIFEENTELIGADLSKVGVYTISDILFAIENEMTRYLVIKKMISNSDFSSFQYLLNLLHIIELSNGKIVDREDEQTEKLVSSEYLVALENIFLQRTKVFVEEMNLLDWKEAKPASVIWSSIEEETYKEYMDKILIDDLSVLKYLSICADKWTSTNGLTGYSFDNKSYKKYTSDNKIISTIEKMRLTNQFWNMDLRVREVAVSFFLLAEGGKRSHEINNISIEEKYNEWKSEFEKQKFHQEVDQE